MVKIIAIINLGCQVGQVRTGSCGLAERCAGVLGGGPVVRSLGARPRRRLGPGVGSREEVLALWSASEAKFVQSFYYILCDHFTILSICYIFNYS